MEQRSSTRNAYFGDLHVHTKYFFDAYIYGTRNDPDDAYRFAKGEALTHAAGLEMRLARSPYSSPNASSTLPGPDV